MHNIVISGFSGIGKSIATKAFKDRVIDLESSEYSKKEDGTTNPLWPKNYVQKIHYEYYSGANKIILISCHENVRKLLHAESLPFLIVLPHDGLKNEYLIRWLARGSSMKFIQDMNDNWYKYIMSCVEDPAPKIYLESSDKYLVDIIRRIYYEEMK